MESQSHRPQQSVLEMQIKVSGISIGPRLNLSSERRLPQNCIKSQSVNTVEMVLTKAANVTFFRLLAVVCWNYSIGLLPYNNFCLPTLQWCISVEVDICAVDCVSRISHGLVRMHAVVYTALM